MQSTSGAVPPPGFIVVLVSGRARVGGETLDADFPFSAMIYRGGKREEIGTLVSIHLFFQVHNVEVLIMDN